MAQPAWAQGVDDVKGELGIVHAKVDKLSGTVDGLTRESRIARQSAVQSNQSVSGVLADALRGLVRQFSEEGSRTEVCGRDWQPEKMAMGGQGTARQPPQRSDNNQDQLFFFPGHPRRRGDNRASRLAA